ncbi:hypothetical protein BU15DRAFT_59174 [Melanogaster broomeanus]|nr:hypothetical protein BU15DRAFT_59174 [Melanogaster broomeanus]
MSEEEPDNQLRATVISTSDRPQREPSAVASTRESPTPSQPASRSRKRSSRSEQPSDVEERLPTKPTKRKRHTKGPKAPKRKVLDDETPESGGEDEADAPSREISGHVFLESTSTQVISARGRSGKGSTTVVKSVQCPAFLFSTITSFNDLVQEIAKAAKTNVAQLILTRLHWKHETPAKGERKLLANDVGYKAMLKSIEAKKGNPVIFFYLPKPAEIEEPPVLSTIQNNLMMANYDELTSGENDSIKGQIDLMRNSYGVQRSQLDERYPVGNHPLFPGKRIYAAKEKDFWELSPLRLDVWASAIVWSFLVAKGRATYDTPPISAHFTASATIKPRRPEPGSPLATFTAYHMYQKATTGHAEALPPPIAGNELVYQPGTAPPLMPAGVYPSPNMLQPYYPQYPGFPLPYFPPGPSYYTLPYQVLPNSQVSGSNMHPMHNPPSPMSSPSATTSHHVTLETFCTRYMISTKDSERLAALEYMPGNRLVEHLSEADWKAAGFSILGWRGFLYAHGKFCKAIRDGSWAVSENIAMRTTS